MAASVKILMSSLFRVNIIKIDISLHVAKYDFDAVGEILVFHQERMR